ncbi:hypothetical protein H4R35_003199 [Dimargaris xerosporica]|nr:hypothetical protein H4R35_003199 [Dimargaris xerosporica]
MAQELLTTFSGVIGEVALVPGDDAVFRISVNDVLVFDRKTEGHLPELKEIKQRIRDIVAPTMSLGHSDRPAVSSTAATAPENCSSCFPPCQ